MGEFIGRDKELRILEKLEGRGLAAIVYGRRRIGKSTMLKKFCEGKRCLYIKCIQNSIRINFTYISGIISRFTGNETKIDSWVDFETEISEILKGSPTIVVIDEYPFLREWDESADSIIQHIIDDGLDGTQSTMILCGSSISVMRAIVENGKGPLYGRFRRIIKLGPLSLSECHMMHPHLSDMDNLKLYLTVGGIPKYHQELGVESYDEYIESNCIDNSWISDETSFLLKSEYENSSKYEAVLAAVSNGSTNAKNIAESAGIDDSICTKILKNLVLNDILGIVTPMMGAPKRPRYYIKDPLTAFCHDVLFKYESLLEGNDHDRVMQTLSHYLSTYLGKRFELFCHDWMKASYNIIKIGKWWIDDPRRNIHEDIDIVARAGIGDVRVDLFVECKFRSNRIGFHDYNILEQRCRRFMDGNFRLVMISISGFDEDLAEFADGTGVMLIGPDEILGHKEAPRIPIQLRKPSISSRPAPPHPSPRPSMQLVIFPTDLLTRRRTSLSIANRLSTIRDDSEVQAAKQRLARNGFYADLYNSQFEPT